MLRRLVAGVLICLCSLDLQAQYTLSAQKIAANTWVVEGSTDNFSPQNGGNIVNVGFIETPVGVVFHGVWLIADEEEGAQQGE